MYKVKVTDEYLDLYIDTLSQYILSDKVKSITSFDKVTSVDLLKEIDNSTDLEKFILDKLSEEEYKRLRNAVYQRKYNSENYLVTMKVRYSLHSRLEEIQKYLGSRNINLALEKVLDYFDENYEEPYEDEDEESNIIDFENEEESSNDFSMPLGIKSDFSFSNLGYSGYSRNEDLYTHVEYGRDSKIYTKSEAYAQYKQGLDKYKLKKSNPKINKIIKELFPEELNIENIVTTPQNCHKIREKLIEESLIDNIVNKDSIVISKVVSIAEYQDEAYGFNLRDLLERCFGVATGCASTKNNDDAFVFKGMASNVQAAYNIFMRQFKFFKEHGKEIMDSFHKNTKLANKRSRLDWKLVHVINDMIENFDKGREYEFHYMDEENMKKLNYAWITHPFSQIYEKVY